MSSNGRRRVVITGLGCVSPLGNTVEDSWQALLAGQSGSGPITLFDAADHPTRFACEVRGLDISAYVERKDARRMDRCTQLALVAAQGYEYDRARTAMSEKYPMTPAGQASMKAH